MESLKLRNIHKEIAARKLFEFSELHLNQGACVGLIGPNGAGKSTLLRMIIGEDTDYQGQIEAPERIGYVPQLKELSTESGGEQVQRYLNQVFSQGADLLILDEPTANLDQENIQRLINQLRDYQGTALLVSHDRHLLNQVVNKIWVLEDETLTVYTGTYNEVIEIRQKEKQRQQEEYDIYRATVQRLESEAQKRMEKAAKLTRRKKGVSGSEWRARSFAGSYDGQAKALAKTGKNLQKRIEQLDETVPPAKGPVIRLQNVGKLNTEAKTLMNIQAGTVKQGQRQLFKYDTFKIEFGQKLALQGANQSGKTTFVTQLMQQKLRGYYSEHLSIGYFAQNFIQLAADLTVIENVSASSQQDIVTIRNLLAALGFRNQTIEKKVAVLSGGERVRVGFAKVLLSDNNLLILDEPTNYLDIVTLEALEEFLQAYQGTFILISHDQTFVERTAETVWLISNQQLQFPVQQTEYASNREQEIQLLELKRDQMIADSEVTLEEIKEIMQQIAELQRE